MKSLAKIISLLLCFIVTACHTDSDNSPTTPPVATETLYLDHYLGSCFGTFGNYQCFRTKIDSSSAYSDNGCITQIQDFTYEWGFEYEIEVEYLDPAPSSFCGEVRFHSLTKKTAVTLGTQFTFPVDHWGVGPLIKNEGSGLFSVFGVTEFVCASPATCSALDALLGQQAFFQLTFEHGVSSGDPLVLQSFTVN